MVELSGGLAGGGHCVPFPPTSHLCSLWCPSLCASPCVSLFVSRTLSLVLFLCLVLSRSPGVFSQCLFLCVCLCVFLSLCCFLSVWFSHLSSIFPLCTPLHLPKSSVSLSSHCSLCLPCSDTSSWLSLWSSGLQRRVLQPHRQGHFPPVESLSPAWLSLSSLTSGSHQVLLRMAGPSILKDLPGW